MAEKASPPKDPFDAVADKFESFAHSDDPRTNTNFWKKAAEVDYRTEAFHSDMQSKDVRVLVKALQRK